MPFQGPIAGSSPGLPDRRQPDASNSSFALTTHHQKLDVERHPEKAKPTQKRLRAKDQPLANDFVTDLEFDKLLAAWFGNMARVLEPARGFYIWGGYANVANYLPVLKAFSFVTVHLSETGAAEVRGIR